jgi:two-component system chemotaxis response regulator CheY
MVRALVADADHLTRAFLAISLRSIGVNHVVEAASGEETWDKLQGEPFDLLVLDWQMPGRNGLALLADIRSYHATLPILLVTADAHRDHVLEAIKAGASDYLVKPFESSTFESKAARLCGPLSVRGTRSALA